MKELNQVRCDLLFEYVDVLKKVTDNVWVNWSRDVDNENIIICQHSYSIFTKVIDLKYRLDNNILKPLTNTEDIETLEKIILMLGKAILTIINKIKDYEKYDINNQYKKLLKIIIKSIS